MVQRMTDEATSRFLETARADLQRHLGSALVVEAVEIAQQEGEVTLYATVRLGPDRVVFSGAGDNLVAAYGALTRSRVAPTRILPSQRIKR
jgi:hypothetical protein